MRDKKAIWDDLAPLLGEYLEAYGWKALVIGEKGVIDVHENHYGFAVVFEFTGGKMKTKDGEETSDDS